MSDIIYTAKFEQTIIHQHVHLRRESQSHAPVHMLMRLYPIDKSFVFYKAKEGRHVITFNNTKDLLIIPWLLSPWNLFQLPPLTWKRRFLLVQHCLRSDMTMCRHPVWILQCFRLFWIVLWNLPEDLWKKKWNIYLSITFVFHISVKHSTKYIPLENISYRKLKRQSRDTGTESKANRT